VSICYFIWLLVHVNRGPIVKSFKFLFFAYSAILSII
jgi:hypothetical protein